MLLTTAALPQLQQHHHPSLGRLITPGHFYRLADTLAAGYAVAGDDCFQGLNPAARSKGGTTAIACWQTGRESTGGDLNSHVIRFTAARPLSEHAWPADRQPSLLSA